MARPTTNADMLFAAPHTVELVSKRNNERIYVPVLATSILLNPFSMAQMGRVPLSGSDIRSRLITGFCGFLSRWTGDVSFHIAR